MSRCIKFRAWSIEHKRMKMFSSHKDGILYAGGEFSVSSGYDSYDAPTFEDDVNDKYEVMQFTGLKDKNGVEIYEGDIVNDEFDCGQLKRIFWDDEQACFCGSWVGGCGLNKPYSSPVSTSPETISKGNVIGNIYQHPELLEN